MVRPSKADFSDPPPLVWGPTPWAVNRRTFLGTCCVAGVAATAGCGAVSGTRTLSAPTVRVDAPGRKTLVFTADDTEVGHLGVDGTVTDGRIDLSTEVWHRDGTSVDAVQLTVWMPEAARDVPAEVAVVSPVAGDSSPPPAVTLSTPERGLGTRIRVTGLDDLADETIDTLALVVIPGAETASTLRIDTVLELSGGDMFTDGYTLNGELELAYPALADA